MNRPANPLALVCLAAAVLAASAGAGLADDARLDQAVKAVQAWNYGDKADELKYLADEVVKAARDARLKKQMEQRMVRALTGSKSRPARDFFCRQLVLVGGEAAVPALASLLGDAESSHIARYALARIPGEAAGAALRSALGKVDEALKVGIVYSLGRRGDKQACPAVAALLASRNDDLVVASLVALSRMDCPAGVSAIARARTTLPAKLRSAANDAYLSCAARHLAAGRSADAAAIYEQLYRAGEPTMCRIAALKGLIAARGEKATALAIAAMGDKNAKIRQAAIPTLRDVPGAGVTRAIAAELPRQGADAQPVLLAVLADRGDQAALPAVIRAADSASPPVRVAALTALAGLGDASVVGLLAKRAAGKAPREEKDAARTSLQRLQGDAIDAAIVRALRSADAPVRAELIGSLAARKAGGQIAAVLRAARDDDAAVRAAAMRALRELAGAEQLPALVGFLVKVTDARVRGEAEQAVLAAARKVPAGRDPAAAVRAALKRASQPAVKASLVRVLGQIGHADSLDAIYESVRSGSAEVKAAAVRALAAWPDAAPIKVLQSVAEDAAAAKADRVIAFRGYVNMIQSQRDATDQQILAAYAKAMANAPQPQERQLVLSRLASLRHRGALEMAERYRSDKALKAAADAAIKKIQQLLAQPARVTASANADKAGNAIDNNPSTRWDTGAAMKGGEWFKIELDELQSISAIVLDAKGSRNDYPRGYEVYISKSSLGAGKLAAKGKGTGAVTEIKFDRPVAGKTIRIVQTGRTGGLFWSIHELKVKSTPVP